MSADDERRLAELTRLLFSGGVLNKDTDQFVRGLSRDQRRQLHELIDEWYGEWLESAEPELIED